MQSDNKRITLSNQAWKKPKRNRWTHQPLLLCYTLCLIVVDEISWSLGKSKVWNAMSSACFIFPVLSFAVDKTA